MDYNAFYEQLFAPLEARLGRPLDVDTLMAIIGFDEGGPVNLCTLGRDAGEACVAYVSCEMAVRDEQVPNAAGRYELLMSCDDEDWARSILSDTAHMSLDVAFNDGDTLDIGGWVDGDDTLQGLLFRQEYALAVAGRDAGVVRCVGITRAEMELARAQGTDALVARLEAAGIHPHTFVGRPSVV